MEGPKVPWLGPNVKFNFITHNGKAPVFLDGTYQKPIKIEAQSDNNVDTVNHNHYRNNKNRCKKSKICNSDPLIHTDAIFGKKISRAQATGRQSLPMPAKFIHHFLHHRPHTITLIDEQCVKTPFEMLWRTGEKWVCYLGQGWYQFVTSHCLKQHDKLLFVPTDNGKDLHVFINKFTDLA